MISTLILLLCYFKNDDFSIFIIGDWQCAKYGNVFSVSL